MTKKTKRPRGLIPLLCYGAALAVWLVLSLALLLGDTAARLTGRLTAQELPLAELELCSLVQTGDGALQATDPDPQLRWVNPDGRTVRSLTLTAQYSEAMGESALYYTEQPGEEFSREKRVFPTDNGDGSYTFILPESGVYALRLDPCSGALRMTGLSVRLNDPVPLGWYLLPDWRQAFALLLLPGLAASGVNILCTAWQRRRKAGGKTVS